MPDPKAVAERPTWIGPFLLTTLLSIALGYGWWQERSLRVPRPLIIMELGLPNPVVSCTGEVLEDCEYTMVCGSGRGESP